MKLFAPIYFCGTFIISILLFIPFLISARGRRRLAERYGDWNLPPGDYIWFHGASLGEVRGLIPIIEIVKKRHPEAQLLLTATTDTGLHDGAAHVHQSRLLPFDNAIWIRRALKGVLIKQFAFGETELWPGLFSQLHSRGCPMFLVNGRISDFSYRYYRVFRPLFKSALRKLKLILVANDEAAERFKLMGAESSKVLVCGNTKYDRQPSAVGALRIKTQLDFFGEEGPTITLGSLHPGEDEIWFAPLAQFLKADARFKVVIAPRHLEKVPYFEKTLKHAGIEFGKRTHPSDSRKKRVLLLDTMGELDRAYSFSILSYVGGTYITGIGGHNPFEAAAYGNCILIGPFYENCRDIVDNLRAENAVSIVETAEQVEQYLTKLRMNDSEIQERGKRAQAVWEKNLGAISRVMEAIDTYSSSNSPTGSVATA